MSNENAPEVTAPERLRIAPWYPLGANWADAKTFVGERSGKRVEGTAEYVRADIADAQADELRAEVERLKVKLQWAESREQPAEPVDRMALGYEQVHLGLDHYRALVEAQLNGDGTATGWYLLTITVSSPELCEEEKELVTRKEYELPQQAWLAFDRLIAETAQGLSTIGGWAEHFARLGDEGNTPVVGIAFEHMEALEKALSIGNIPCFGGRWDGDRDSLYIWKGEGEDDGSGYVKEDDGDIILQVAAEDDQRFTPIQVHAPAYFAEIATERTPKASE
jgi:hypothetical protein